MPHTPGPWVVANEMVETHDFVPISLNIEESPEGETISLIPFNELSPFASRWRADAQLIAAAPELLAACQRSLAWLEQHGISSPITADLRAAVFTAITTTNNTRTSQ